MAETTTGTGMYSVAPTVLPKQGVSPHEVLAQQTQQAQAAKAQEAARAAKRREEAMANAASLMEGIDAENWKTDSDYFNKRYTAMTDKYAEILQRSGGNPSPTDLNELNSAVRQYKEESNYSMQAQNEYKNFEGIINDPNKYDKYTPESIEENASWYALPFEDRMVTPKPRLQFIPEIEDWETTIESKFKGTNFGKSSAYKSVEGDFIKGGAGISFDEDKFLPWAEDIYNLGVESDGYVADDSIQQMIIDLTHNNPELAKLNGPAKEEARKEIVIDALRNMAMGRTKTGRTSATLTDVPGAGDDDEPPLYDPNTPDTPGEATMNVIGEDGTEVEVTIPFENEYNTKVKGGSSNLNSIRAGKMYIEGKGGVDLGDLEKNKMVIIEQDPIVIEGADVPGVGKGDYLMVDVKVDDLVYGTIHKTGYIPIAAGVDKELRNASDYYRSKKEYEEGGASTFDPNSYKKK